MHDKPRLVLLPIRNTDIQLPINIHSVVYAIQPDDRQDVVRIAPGDGIDAELSRQSKGYQRWCETDDGLTRPGSASSTLLTTGEGLPSCGVPSGPMMPLTLLIIL